MMRRLFIVFLMVLLIFIEVDILAQRVFSETEIAEKTGRQKSKSKFRFRKSRFRKPDAVKYIDTGSVYIFSTYSEIRKSQVYRFVRFFSNGEVYYSFNYYSLPSEYEFNTLNYGMWQMYTVKKGEPVVEIYISNSIVHFRYEHAKIINDELRFYKYKIGKAPGGKVVRFSENYKKIPVNFASYLCPWK